jgi:2-dehydropantoate 2-reductase
MKIAVMGAGAVGSYFGGRLAQNGEDVVFIARGTHLNALKERGLTVSSFKESFSIKVNATSDPKELGILDLILFTVKSYDTEEAASLLTSNVGENTVILTLQNGIDNFEKLERILGRGRIIWGVTYIGSRILEPGIIYHTTGGSIIMGEINGKRSERLKIISKLFENARVKVTISDNIRKDSWIKLLWNASFNPLTALTSLYVKEFLNIEGSEEIIEEIMKEVKEVARSEGIYIEDEIISRTIENTKKFGEVKTSMFQDIEKGKKLELDGINGIVIKLGEKNGIPTPINKTIYYLLKIKSNYRRC